MYKKYSFKKNSGFIVADNHFIIWYDLHNRKSFYLLIPFQYLILIPCDQQTFNFQYWAHILYNRLLDLKTQKNNVNWSRNRYKIFFLRIKNKG